MATKKIVVDLLKNVTEKEAKSLVLDVHERLVRETPVDTGWARNNWIPSVAQPYLQTAGTPEHLNSAPQNTGVVELLQWEFTKGPAYITNNVPYIQRLNNGSSNQAPKGFVEKAIQAAVNKSNRKTLK